MYDKLDPQDNGAKVLDFSTLSQLMKKIVFCFEDVSVIVDGLGECGNNTSNAVLLISNLVSEGDGRVRALLLSRDEYEIREILQHGYSNVQIAAHKEDLELYVAAEIESRQHKFGRNQLRIKSPDLKEHIIRTLVDKADGMFRWVACQLDLLTELPTDAAKRKALTTMPKTLFATYEVILNRINERHPVVRLMVQRALMWIVHGPYRMSTAAVCEAVFIEENATTIDKETICETEYILMHCSSLIRLSPERDFFELAHFTVEEFLTNLSTAADSPFAFYSQAEDVVTPVLARTCLNYLLYNDFSNHVIEEYDAWEQQKTDYPFRHTALIRWIPEEFSGVDNTMCDQLRQLFNPSKTICFLSWARDYTYLTAEHEFVSPKDRKELFEQCTNIICTGRVTPLHMAAAIGHSELCNWILGSYLESQSPVNHMSTVGTPLHCDLIGPAIVLHYMRGYTQFEDHWKPENRSETLKILLEGGADVNASYRDADGDEFSSTLLATHFYTEKAIDHPLVMLIKAGGILDQDTISSIKIYHFHAYGKDSDGSTDDVGDVFPESIELVDSIISSLEELDGDKEVPSQFLQLALRSRKQTALRLMRKSSDIRMPVIELHETFFRAIKYDQKEVVMELALDARLNPLVIYTDGQKSPLQHAANYESVNVLEYLLTLGVEVDAADENGRTALHYAVARQSSDEYNLSLLLKHGASTSTKDMDGCTVWHIAAQYGNTVAIHALGRCGDSRGDAQIIPDGDGFIPLIIASHCEHSETFDVLQAYVKDVGELPETFPDDLGLVHHAVSMNCITLLRKLDRASILQKTQTCRNALHSITDGTNTEIIQMIIDMGVDPVEADCDGKTPLHELIVDDIQLDQQGFELLATEATINLATLDGLTALHYTVFAGDLRANSEVLYDERSQAFERLLRRGADLYATDRRGSSIIDMLFDLEAHEVKRIGPKRQSQDRRRFVKFLTLAIENITDLRLLNGLITWAGSSYMLLSWALRMQEEDLAKLLLAKKVDVNIIPEYSPGSSDCSGGQSAAQTACSNGTSPNILGEILNRCHGKFERTEKGLSLLHLACSEGARTDTSILEKLCEYGFDLDAEHSVETCTEEVPTPLMLACKFGRLSHVQFLLQHGVNYRARHHTRQANHYAIINNHFKVFEEFLGLDFAWNKATTKLDFHGYKWSRCNSLHFAAVSPDEIYTKMILQHSLVRNVNELNGQGLSSLHLAAVVGNAATIEILLSNGADIEQEGPSRSRAIGWAAGCGKAANVQLLLSRGCSLVPDSHGMTPEFTALSCGQTEIADMINTYGLTDADTMNPRAMKAIDSDEDGILTLTIISLVKDEALELPANIAPLTRINRGQQIFFAIERSDLVRCKMLVESGADINEISRTCGQCTPVLVALERRSFEIANYLLQKGASTIGQLCSHSDLRGYSAVHLACSQAAGSAILPVLLELDLIAGSPSFKSPINPIHVAVACDNPSGLKILLEHALREGWVSTNAENNPTKTFPRFRITFKNDQYIEPLSIIDERIYTRELEWTWKLSPKLRISLEQGLGQPAAIHLAIGEGSIESFKLLIKYGANIEHNNLEGSTPLVLAVSFGRLEYVQYLFDNGVRIRARHGAEAIAEAASRGNLPILKQLKDKGVPLHFSDSFSCTILHRGAAITGSPEVFSYLLLSGCSPYTKNSREEATPIDVALNWWRRPSAMLSLILNWDLDFDRCIRTVSYKADWFFEVRRFKLLFRRLRREMSFRQVNQTLRTHGCLDTPLIYASIKGNIEAVELFINTGADLDYQDGPDGTALMTACQYGQLASVIYLVRAGASLFSKKDDKEITAIQAAENFPDIIQWLLVGRFTSQCKICWETEGAADRGISSWPGPLSVGVPVSGLYSPSSKQSSLDRAKDLARLRKDLQGQVVHY